MNPASPADPPVPAATLFGHPVGLFQLFFVEMWERFCFYGMRALLVLFLGKCFLYSDEDSNAVYGAYTALVYMTPFFGGMLADRLLGARRAIILGALLMAAGELFLTGSAWVAADILRLHTPADQLLLTRTRDLTFFAGLALLIAGNGFFKPNISTIVGSLYAPGSTKRDGGFTIFYMGINLGAALGALLCSYLGDAYGWHCGFGLAAVGMLVGTAVFVAPNLVSRLLILATALAAAAGLFYLHADNVFSLGVNAFTAISLLLAGGAAWLGMRRGNVPAEAGAPPDRQRLRRPVLGPLSREWLLWLGSLAAILVFVLLVSGLAFFTADHRPLALIPDSAIEGLRSSANPLLRVLAVVAKETSRPATLVLALAGLAAFGYVGLETFRLPPVPRQRMYVVLVLTFFSMLFWSFFEQAGSSLTNFTDRNVERVPTHRAVAAEEPGAALNTAGEDGWHGHAITPADVGKTIQIQPTQKQLGYHNGREVFTSNLLDKLREEHKSGPHPDPDFQIDWQVAADNVGMQIAHRNDEIPAGTFQSVNSIFILIFGLIFTALWTLLAARGLEPSTPVKFALGLLQLGLGFAALWYGARLADSRGMVAVGWLLLSYLLQTTGELCLSPVGLSMVTKLSPLRLVSTVMGLWFLATAFSQSLAALIAQFTGVSEGSGQEMTIPPPSATVHVYGAVFGKIAVAAVISAALCLALAPLLNRWMHPEADA